MMADIMVDKLDFQKYGVKAVYLIGSTKEATAGPSSDLDFIIHVESKNSIETQKLEEWINGWSLALNEMNYERTGYSLKTGLIDTHFVDEADFKNKDSYATMIGSHSNSARLLKKLN